MMERIGAVDNWESTDEASFESIKEMSMLNRIKVTWDFHSEDLEDGWQGAFNRSISCRARGKCVVQLVFEAYLEQSRNLSTLATSVSGLRTHCSYVQAKGALCKSNRMNSVND